MHPRFAKPLDSLPAPLKAALLPMLDPEQGGEFNARFTPEQVTTLKAATGLEDRALRLALLPLAAACSVAPISRFFVGAIACGLSGTWYFGANMEFTGQGLFHSVHAEQSAISNAWLGGETGISEITVNYTPCGHCRQFMNELSTAKILKVSLPDDLSALQSFLPHSFGPADLDITDALMSPQAHDELMLESEDPLWQAALAAARQSYAPYSQGYAAVALQFADGRLFCGRYAENAAFNPSLPPMQMACAHAVLNGEDLATLRRAVLLESKNGQISQRDSAQSTLKALGSVELEYQAV
ncbi:cytidine deaminase [Aeromonas sp. HMWF014]|jgi:cytidine deaminase|uniref:cytidine deaminase n=1 Tax=Aeromonas sp. HMWF014 TaxID=2056850 RepID=UPI000D3D5EBA|nr:cytidine deaminase [Aeromonas sp. HMWF014]PTT51166.1 cytidine deaminase [Aeromonas sp. HMWF014]